MISSFVTTTVLSPNILPCIRSEKKGVRDSGEMDTAQCTHDPLMSEGDVPFCSAFVPLANLGVLLRQQHISQRGDRVVQYSIRQQKREQLRGRVSGREEIERVTTSISRQLNRRICPPPTLDNVPNKMGSCARRIGLASSLPSHSAPARFATPSTPASTLDPDDARLKGTLFSAISLVAVVAVTQIRHQKREGRARSGQVR
jgi:hypothetical protein